MKKKYVQFGKLFIIGMFISILLVFMYGFYNCMVYELHHAYTSDAPLYWAVGRGILNGLTPYSQMYENKPLGIFLLSAFCFLFSDNTILCNVFTLISLLIIAILPVFMIIKNNSYKINKKIDEKSLLIIMVVFLVSMMLMTYSEERSGGFQVESLGAAASLLYIWSIIKLKHAENNKQKKIMTIFSAIIIQLVVLMKEPFLFITIAGSLLFIDSIKDFWQCIVNPGLLGGIAYIIVLDIFKVLIPYFNIYVSHMLNMKMAGRSTAFSRAKNISFLFEDLSDFNVFLPYILIIFLIISLLGVLYYKKISMKFYHIIRIIIAIFISSFCVGMGGQYYNHHYIFALPIYSCFVIYGCKVLNNIIDAKKSVRFIIVTFIILLIIINAANANRTYGGDYTERYLLIKRHAEYVDKLLDYYGEDKYQFIGFNGEDMFFGLTKHSPQGPIFAQDRSNFLTTDAWFIEKFIDQLYDSNIIIIKKTAKPLIGDSIQNILNDEFTTIPQGDFMDLPNSFNYIIYYRKEKYIN